LNIVEISKVISTLFAGCSVLAAIYIYKLSSDRDYFGAYRKSLFKYRQLTEEAVELFDEIGLVEIGASVAKELRDVCPQNLSASEIQGFLNKEENEDFIRQAIYLGLGNSKTLNRAKKISSEIGEIPNEYREAFPITSTTLGILNAYYMAIVNTVSSGELISSLFENARENKAEKEELKPEDFPYPDLIFREIAVYITVLHIDFTNNYADIMLEQSESISNIISGCYESLSDRDLRKQSEKEKSSQKQFSSNGNSVKDNFKKLFEYLKFYKSTVDTDNWDKLVESKTLMESVASQGEGQ